jgi:hypothetical protein
VSVELKVVWKDVGMAFKVAIVEHFHGLVEETIE